MKIKITKDLTVACTDGVIRDCKPDDIVSVYHSNGRRLLYRRMALWISREVFDPAWDPPDLMKMATPKHDKMMRGPIVNKGAA